MLYEFYTHIAETISEEIEAIQWIDLDRGQLSQPEHFESLILPCVLINLSDGIGWQGLTGGHQFSEADLSLKIVVRLPEPIYHNQRYNKNNDILCIEDDVHIIAHRKLQFQRLGTKAYPASKTYFVIEHFYKAGFDYNMKTEVTKHRLTNFEKAIDFQLKRE
jgi:hypothetical protein